MLYLSRVRNILLRDFLATSFTFLAKCCIVSAFGSGKKAQEAKRRAAGDSLSMREDEMEVALKKRRARAAANEKYDNLVKASIKGTKRENMQSQELLRMEMQMAYKHGKEAFCFGLGGGYSLSCMAVVSVEMKMAYKCAACVRACVPGKFFYNDGGWRNEGILSSLFPRLQSAVCSEMLTPSSARPPARPPVTTVCEDFLTLPLPVPSPHRQTRL